MEEIFLLGEGVYPTFPNEIEEKRWKLEQN
jgi:hypothetical protein